MNKLLRTSFTLGLDGAAAAGPVGRSASGQTDALLGAEIISYSRSHGLFAGVSVDGATLRPDHGSNRNLYGYEPKVRDLLQGAVTAPEAAARFLGVLNDQSPRKRLQEASSAGE
jgi:lipid-binding SYLF domain-containing protein